jgi:ethanolamine phosphate transferase 2 subunit G
MVIDAMRADLIKKMNFLNGKLIKKNLVYSMKAHSHPPTVTMPRLKSMTSGIMPNFIDIIMNFDSQKFKVENWIQKFKEENKTILLYGDETWLKLFPEEFSPRSEGTTSFFVTDTEIVDSNVTRNVNKELYKNNWDVMILHYLGLDHIGHIGNF